MRAPLIPFATLFLALFTAAAQQQPIEDREPRLPSGKSQREEILRSEHEKSLKDADELMQLSEQLKIELERNDRHVLSVATLKKLDEMEKLVKRIRSRMKRY